MDWEKELDSIVANAAANKSVSTEATAKQTPQRRMADDATHKAFSEVIVPALRDAERALCKKGLSCRVEISEGAGAADGSRFTNGAILAIVRKGQLPPKLDWDNDEAYSRLTFRAPNGSSDCYIASQLRYSFAPLELDKTPCFSISKGFVEQKLLTFVAKALGA